MSFLPRCWLFLPIPYHQEIVKIPYFYEPKAGGPTDQTRACQRTAGVMERRQSHSVAELSRACRDCKVQGSLLMLPLRHA